MKLKSPRIRLNSSPAWCMQIYTHKRWTSYQKVMYRSSLTEGRDGIHMHAKAPVSCTKTSPYDLLTSTMVNLHLKHIENNTVAYCSICWIPLHIRWSYRRSMWCWLRQEHLPPVAEYQFIDYHDNQISYSSPRRISNKYSEPDLLLGKSMTCSCLKQKTGWWDPKLRGHRSVHFMLNWFLWTYAVHLFPNYTLSWMQ